MKLWEHYHTPATTDEALGLLRQYAGRARVIAGGTDLLVDARAAVTDPGKAAAFQPHEALIDITRIPEMTHIAETDDAIVIGAGVTHTQIVKSALIKRYAACLVESCGVVGGPQVRNVATLGGNVAHALPAGDGTTSLVALDAEAEISQGGVRRWVPILDLFVGTGKSLVDSTQDMLIGFRFRKTAPDQATAFSRIMRPQGVALPILGCAVWMHVNGEGTHCAAARICIAPVAPTPKRAHEVEAAISGQPLGEALIETAIQAADQSLAPRTSKYRATAEYRDEMMAVLLRRTITACMNRLSAV
ncbi:MAG: FAD binding domain-containing protein [bacterium]|nr:FAD binding domain-containing protein [bacterium]